MDLLRKRVEDLRGQGLTLQVISSKTGVPTTSLSRWLKSVKSPRVRLAEQLSVAVRGAVGDAIFGKNESKILCALIYWCEGNKSIKDTVAFTNSDPQLIATFLRLLRSSYNLDERKFRVCMHLHDYHDEEAQGRYWSNLTKIPGSQFTKTYQKKSNHIYPKKGYEGCIRIRYYDTQLAKTLLMTAQAFMNKYK